MKWPNRHTHFRKSDIVNRHFILVVTDEDGVLIWISLCNLWVLCVSVVVVSNYSLTTETQRTQRLHRGPGR